MSNTFTASNGTYTVTTGSTGTLVNNAAGTYTYKLTASGAGSGSSANGEGGGGGGECAVWTTPRPAGTTDYYDVGVAGGFNGDGHSTGIYSDAANVINLAIANGGTKGTTTGGAGGTGGTGHILSAGGTGGNGGGVGGGGGGGGASGGPTGVGTPGANASGATHGAGGAAVTGGGAGGDGGNNTLVGVVGSDPGGGGGGGGAGANGKAGGAGQMIVVFTLSNRPAGWPTSFHAALDNGTDVYDDDMPWVDDLSNVFLYTGSFPTITGGGYYLRTGDSNGVVGLFNGAGKMLLLQDDGGDFAGEMYGEWTWNGSAFVSPDYTDVPNNTGYDFGTPTFDSLGVNNNTLSNYVGGFAVAAVRMASRTTGPGRRLRQLGIRR